MKNKLLIPLLGLVASVSLTGGAYASWAFDGPVIDGNTVQVSIPEWTFGDMGFAKIANVGSLSNLVATKEEVVTRGSTEAVRITNTAGTQTKDHVINLAFDKDYTLAEIQTHKLEFDYYHEYKREQNTKGFPKLQFTYNSTSVGADQGGTDTINDKSPFVMTDMGEGWWHLEYFVFAHCPTMADHQDTPIALTKKVNGIKITDRGIYDYGGITAFAIIDNLLFSPEPAARLGLFNRTTSYPAGTYYWFKVAFSGELHSCVITTSDPTIAIQDTESTKSPFYVKGLRAGTVTVTATLDIGSNHQVMSISNTLTVS